MEQLLQLERLRTGPLKNVSVAVVVPEEPRKIREELTSLAGNRRVRLSHAFYSREPVRTIHRGGPRAAPLDAGASLVLYDARGVERWRFVEKAHRMRPSERDLVNAVARLSAVEE